MSPRERIHEMLRLADSDDRRFPATIFFNEGWLLRVVLDWFARRTGDGHRLDFALRAEWFSEALLPSQFLAGRRSDNLAEGYTHADGVIGHVAIGRDALANAMLASDASQFVVTEAKLFSPLSPGVTHARFFDQAARNVACMAQVLQIADRRPGAFSSLGFFVLAPEKQINDPKLFAPLLAKTSIMDKVSRRVAQYRERPDGEAKQQWLRDWFEPTLERAAIALIAWEEIVDFVCAKEPAFGAELRIFYGECCRFNGMQEPETAAEAQRNAE